MSTGEWIVVLLVFALAAVLLVLSVRHFMERGFLLNNAYIYASEQERKAMNKKPYYRQSAIVFCILSAVFVIIGLSVVLHNDRFLLLQIPLTAGAIVYAAASAVRISRREKK